MKIFRKNAPPHRVFENFVDMTSIVVKPLFVLLRQDAPSSIDCLFNGVCVVQLAAHGIAQQFDFGHMPMRAAGMEGKCILQRS